MAVNVSSLAEHAINASAIAMRNVLSRLDRVNADSDEARIIQDEFITFIQPLARLEKDLYQALDDSERSRLKAQAEGVLDELSGGKRDEYGGFFPLMDRLGLARRTRLLRPGEQSGGGPCRCTGILVCYRECCANGAGHGVGVGLWDCSHTICDGCP